MITVGFGVDRLLSTPCVRTSMKHWISQLILHVIAFGIPGCLLLGGVIFGRASVVLYVGYWVVLMRVFLIPYVLVGVNCYARHSVVDHQQSWGSGSGGGWGRGGAPNARHADEDEQRKLDRVWLERMLSGLAGVRIIVVALITLLPSVLSWKVRGRFELPIAGVVYVAYHGIGAYLWYKVHHVQALDKSSLAMTPAERATEFDGLVPLARFWEKLGLIVIVLVIMNLALAGKVAGKEIPAPDFVRGFFGISVVKAEGDGILAPDFVRHFLGTPVVIDRVP